MSTRYVPNPKLDLVLTREIDVPRRLVWEAWTTPDLLKQWFCPAPWYVSTCELDLRPGGKFRAVMCSPEGDEHDNTGCYLEIVPEERLLWTDALGPDYRPNGGGFASCLLTLEDKGAGTLYTATAMHADPETRAKHEEMGFHGGWSTALDQLIALIKSR